MSLRTLIAGCALGATLLFVGTANAAILAGWNFNDGRFTGGSNNFGPSPAAPTSQESNLSVVGLTRGSGVGTTGTGAGNAWGGNAWDGPTDLAAAVAAGNYATFSFEADPGWEVSFSGIDAYNVRRSGTGPTTGQWQYSLDGTSFTNITGAITWGATTTAAGNPQGAVDLSGIGDLQNVASGTTVTFRVVNWSASGGAGTWYLNNHAGTTELDFVVRGEVIPEPASLSLLALGGLALIRRRR